ncbi:MAG: LPS export ABC transporter permease LptG [Limimaricola sp.]|uniref:LPS export ABC transporter permease LptG n=1 Tax=Limimaricola sp. TaxID=2211665 RepID=UPI001D4BF6CA|nr:LPS export ABC transporter permease LptG [Limimaricola sp.]MBI1418289.1 LPS export ABC transporter permease LptG [Limimaricola sp.]
MILHRYFARRFLFAFAGVFAIFSVMTGFLDLIDQLRRFGGSGASFDAILGLSLLNLPGAVYKILPLIMILATIAMFLSLARSSEMVVTRAAGRSALRALTAPIGVTLVLGTLAVAVMNPIVAATSRQYDLRAGRLSGHDNVLSISRDGLWLRQGGAAGQTVIRATGANLDGTRLSGVTFFGFGPDGAPRERVEAKTAVLRDGGWTLSDAKVWDLSAGGNPEAGALTSPSYRIASTLTPDQIRDSFGAPSSISIWDLPNFIAQLRGAGFSVTRHEVWLQSELTLPTFLIAMVLIGAGFTMRHQRGGNTGVMVLAAILLGFGLYFIRNFAQALGENGQLPVLLAAWAPPLAAIGLSLGLILHLEDG